MNLIEVEISKEREYFHRIDQSTRDFARSADMLRVMSKCRHYDIFRLSEMKNDLLQTHCDLSHVMADLMNEGWAKHPSFLAANEVRHFVELQVGAICSLMAGRKSKRKKGDEQTDGV